MSWPSPQGSKQGLYYYFHTFAKALAAWAERNQDYGPALGAEFDRIAVPQQHHRDADAQHRHEEGAAAGEEGELDDEERATALAARAARLGLPFLRISGVSGQGVPELLEAAWRVLAQCLLITVPLNGVNSQTAPFVRRDP